MASCPQETPKVGSRIALLATRKVRLEAVRDALGAVVSAVVVALLVTRVDSSVRLETASNSVAMLDVEASQAVRTPTNSYVVTVQVNARTPIFGSRGIGPVEVHGSSRAVRPP